MSDKSTQTEETATKGFTKKRIENNEGLSVSKPTSSKSEQLQIKPEESAQDDFTELVKTENEAKIVTIPSLPLDTFSFEERDKTALELINCNLVRALKLSEDANQQKSDDLESATVKLKELTSEAEDGEKKLSTLQNLVRLLKVDFYH